MACTEKMINDNADWVRTNRDQKEYAPVTVTITKVVSTTAGITVDFTAESRTSKGEKGPLKLVQDVPWNQTNTDIWTGCPSTLPSDPMDPAKPKLDATEVLYLEKNLLDTQMIYGIPKWPTSLPTVLVKQVPVWPTSVIVEGYQLLDGTFSKGSVDLLNPDHALTLAGLEPVEAAAAPPQKIVLDGSAVMLSLTSAGFEEGFGLTFPLDLLKKAVAIIKEGADARSMADAWRTIARWEGMARTKPSMVTPEARQLVRQVLKQLDL
jgi:hypothetical protein